MAAVRSGLNCGRGYVDPRILRAAEAIRRKGWRVTSIYRFADSSAHGRGAALDIAPMVAHRCVYDAELARLVLLYLTRLVAGTAFRVISEVDHIHIELSSHPSYGTFLNQELIEHDL